MNDTHESLPEQLDEEALAQMEHRLREGLGPEAGLVDVFKSGEDVQALLNTPGGRAIVEECTRRATQFLEDLTSEVGLPPEKEREALLALRLNVGILRRIAAMVAAGNNAAAALRIREQELQQEH